MDETQGGLGPADSALCARARRTSVLLGVLVLASLYLASLYSYLLFHSLAEGFSIVVACGVFMLAWNSRRLVRNDYLLFLGIAYLFVAAVDFVHTLSYKGMEVFPGYGTDLSAQLWIAGRYVESLSLLLAPLFLRRRLRPVPAILGYVVLVSALLAAVFSGLFPVCFIEGEGLTLFKKASEYVICLVLVGAAAILWRRSSEIDRGVLRLVTASIAVTVGSEISFTLFRDVYGLPNLIGHFLKIVSFYLVYKAIIETGLVRPYDLLFRNLKQSEEELRRAHDGLERRVRERTTALTAANKELRREVAERKRAEDEKTKVEEQLRQSQKLEAIGRLAGGVAHDFNNMLGAIIGYSDILLSAAGLDAQSRTDIEHIKGAADRAADLTRQLLAFSRKQALQPRVMDFNAAVTGLEKMLRRLIGEDIEFSTVLAEDLGHVKADPGQVDQIIMNLAVNARDAMPGGGRLTIETANVELDEDYAETHVEARPGPHVMLAISDTGCGMDEETRSRIFEPFFTTKGAGKGTGLGLSTVYGIVKQSSGNIWVYSEPGKGTTFKIYLPRVEEPVEPAKPRRPAEARAKGSETILVVEDEEVLRRLIIRILSLAGYKVLEAGNGREALELCERHGGPIHLVITDVVMPEMGGRRLAEHAAALRPDMKVAYMSGYTDDAIVRNGTLDPDMPFIQKPFTASSLATKVREVLDSDGANP